MIDFLKSMAMRPGFAAKLPSINALYQSWGHRLDCLQQAALDTLTNRIPGYESDPGPALREFGLPADKRLSLLRWQYSANRGTKQNIVDMLSAVGHPNVSIYNAYGRTDFGPVALPGGPAATLAARYQSGSPNSNPLVWQMGVPWFTIWVRDGLSNLRLNAQGPTKKQGATHLLYENSPAPQWAYNGNTDSQTIAEIARYNRCAGELCLEVFVTYEDTATGTTSAFDQLGEPSNVTTRYSILSIDQAVR
jgi:hypothetical protein